MDWSRRENEADAEPYYPLFHARSSPFGINTHQRKWDCVTELWLTNVSCYSLLLLLGKRGWKPEHELSSDLTKLNYIFSKERTVLAYYTQILQSHWVRCQEAPLGDRMEGHRKS